MVIIPEKCVIMPMGRQIMMVRMKRNAFSRLVRWKDDPDRKPLIIRGARQVGKTWLMKEFGQTCYESSAYFNFDEEDELKSIGLTVPLAVRVAHALQKAGVPLSDNIITDNDLIEELCR